MADVKLQYVPVFNKSRVFKGSHKRKLVPFRDARDKIDWQPTLNFPMISDC